jgi:hypothetical protein
LATACRAAIAARNERKDSIPAIDQQMPWPRFVKCVNAAQAMTTTDPGDTKSDLLTKYTIVRTFASALLDAFNFQGDPTASSLLNALDVAA